MITLFEVTHAKVWRVRGDMIEVYKFFNNMYEW